MGGKLNNPLQDFYDKNKDNVIKIDPEQIDAATASINRKMSEFAVEYREKLSKSIEAASNSFLTF